MPRPREFDEAAALEAAIQCFWKNGYAGSTVRELSVAMGMTNASLYNAFGDKRSLFVRALRRYVDTYSLRRLAEIAAADDPLMALKRFMLGLVKDASTTGRGCLLMSSAAEIPLAEPELRVQLDGHLRRIEKALTAALLAARNNSIIPVTTDCAQKAQVVLSAIISIQILARTQARPVLLAAIAEAALPVAA